MSLCFTYHQQLRSYGIGPWLSLIQRTGGARDQAGDPWVKGECVIHYTMAAPTLTQKGSGCTCVDPESFLRGSLTLTMFFFYYY